VGELLARVESWAAAEVGIAAVALVGSHARGEATPESDIDLILLAYEPASYLNSIPWIGAFGEPVRHEVEDWGRATSLRVWYADGLEVEFGLTGPDWGADPADEGTASVIRDGIRILYDPGDVLSSRVRRQGLNPRSASEARGEGPRAV
jgi:predicted nucleotidyltransferase